MHIDVTELLEKVGNTLELRVSERVSYPEEGLLLMEPVRASVKLTNTGGSLLLQGSVDTMIDLECSRCLTHFGVRTHYDLEEMFGVHEDDLVFPIESDNTVDLGEAIRQNMLLSIPMKPLCKADCKV